MPRPVAVIDIGTSSIRMAIAEISSTGQVRLLETLTQGVSLGKDTFTRGLIEKSTIEGCASVLRSYRRRLAEYQIHSNDQIRVIATSAVREASNRLAFLDRIYIATGFDVEPLDEAEVNRITYLGIQPFLQSEPALAQSRSIVAEIGGGSTELLQVQDGDIISSHSYRLGSLRMLESLQSFRTSARQLRSIMEKQIDRTVDQITHQVAPDGPVEMLAIGGDVRFAASQLVNDWGNLPLARLRTDELEKFTRAMLQLSDDELVRRYHLTFPDAETLGPALLAYVHLARRFGREEIFVTHTNLRDGLLQEMANRGSWTEEFRQQVIRSAMALGRRFEFDEPHATRVAENTLKLFEDLRDEHMLEDRFQLILYLSAILHELGLFINASSHHKHSMYIIINSELFGLSRRDRMLVGLVARYHRRASPKPVHQWYGTLDRDSRIAVTKMAAMLRLADALDRSHSQRISDFKCVREGQNLVLEIPGVEDLSLEQLALKQKGPLFEETFGLRPRLRRVRRQ
ncbi:MAG: exopolyphosphatase [Planctomycetaceae bacterium]|nr:exopolyphosphatase [Planctomycetaceae bacterium]